MRRRAAVRRVGIAIPPAEWEWFGHAAHFICAKDCRFHLATKVGSYLVSTVGEMWGDRRVREIHAKVHDAAWLAANRHLKGDYFDAAYMKRFGYQEIGYNRLYETMVFKAGKRCKSKECGCGLPTISGHDLDFGGYMVAGAAAKGHAAMCLKWSVPTPERGNEEER